MNEQPPTQNELLLGSNLFEPVKQAVLALLLGGRQPSAWELLRDVETQFGLKARWELPAVLEHLADDKNLTGAHRAYCASLRESEDLAEAMRGADAPEKKSSPRLIRCCNKAGLTGAARNFRTW